MIFYIPEEIIMNSFFGDRRIKFFCHMFRSGYESGRFNSFDILYKPKKTDIEFQRFLLAMERGGYLKVISSGLYEKHYSFTDRMEAVRPCGKIYEDELNVIGRKKRGETTLLLLAFIRMRMWTGKSVNLYINEIMEQLGISRYRITESMKRLSDLGVLEIVQTQRYQDNHGNWHSGYTTFCDDFSDD